MAGAIQIGEWRIDPSEVQAAGPATAMTGGDALIICLRGGNKITIGCKFHDRKQITDTLLPLDTQQPIEPPRVCGTCEPESAEETLS